MADIGVSGIDIILFCLSSTESGGIVIWSSLTIISDVTLSLLHASVSSFGSCVVVTGLLISSSSAKITNNHYNVLSCQVTPPECCANNMYKFSFYFKISQNINNNSKLHLYINETVFIHIPNTDIKIKEKACLVKFFCTLFL